MRKDEEKRIGESLVERLAEEAWDEIKFIISERKRLIEQIADVTEKSREEEAVLKKVRLIKK